LVEDPPEGQVALKGVLTRRLAECRNEGQFVPVSRLCDCGTPGLRAQSKVHRSCPTEWKSVTPEVPSSELFVKGKNGRIQMKGDAIGGKRDLRQVCRIEKDRVDKSTVKTSVWKISKMRQS